MAKFIEYQFRRWWYLLFGLSWSLVIPSLASLLFICGLISTFGFMTIVATAMFGLIVLSSGLSGAPGPSSRSLAARFPGGHQSPGGVPFGNSGRIPLVDSPCCSSPSSWDRACYSAW